GRTRGRARSGSAAEVRVHGAELPQPRGCDDVIRKARAARGAVPRGGDPDPRGQPVRAAAVRRGPPAGAALARSRERDLPGDVVEGLLAWGADRMGPGRARRGPAVGAGEGGR